MRKESILELQNGYFVFMVDFHKLCLEAYTPDPHEHNPGRHHQILLFNILPGVLLKRIHFLLLIAPKPFPSNPTLKPLFSLDQPPLLQHHRTVPTTKPILNGIVVLLDVGGDAVEGVIVGL